MSTDKGYCHFCGKDRSGVRKLIAGPSVFICNECVGLCVDMLTEDGIRAGPEPDDYPPQRILKLRMALEPFANFLKGVEPLSLDDFKRAAEAMKPVKVSTSSSKET